MRHATRSSGGGSDEGRNTFRKGMVPQKLKIPKTRRSLDVTHSTFLLREPTRRNAYRRLDRHGASIEGNWEMYDRTVDVLECALQEISLPCGPNHADHPGVTIDNGDFSADYLKMHSSVERVVDEDLKIKDFIEVIHERHRQIVQLSKDTRTISDRVHDIKGRVGKINRLLDRCSEAVDALWKKNEEKEQRNARLRETLRSLRMVHDPNGDDKQTGVNTSQPGIL